MSFFINDQRETLQSFRHSDPLFEDLTDFLSGPLDNYLQEEIAPSATEHDRKEIFDTGAFEGLGELGYFSLPFPEHVGGMNACFTYQVAALESIAKADAGLALGCAIHGTCTDGIISYGSDELIESYVPSLVSGEEMACFCLSEQGGGSDAKEMETTYRKEGDRYLLNGTKYWITNGLSADTYFVLAGKEEEPEQISAFLVRKGSEGTFEQHKIPDKMGVRSSETAELIFRDYEVPADHMIGEEGKGFRYAMNMLNGGRIGIAAWVTGVAQGAFEKILKYATDREMFHGTLADQDLARAEFSEMQSDIWSGRHLAYSAAFHKSEGNAIARRAAIAKVTASEGAVRVCERAIEYGGGHGYVEDGRIERHLRDAILGQIGEGANELLKTKVIPRFLLDDFNPEEVPVW